MNTATPSHFNVFVVEEFDAPTPEDMDRKAKSWTKVGVAFPHKEGAGYNIQLSSLPLDGKLVVLPAHAGEDADSTEYGRRALVSNPGARAARRQPAHTTPGAVRRHGFCGYGAYGAPTHQGRRILPRSALASHWPKRCCC